MFSQRNEKLSIILFFKDSEDGAMTETYCIRHNYRTYPYKRSVKGFRSLQMIVRVLFVYVFLKAYDL